MIITLKSGKKMLDVVALAKGLISPEDLSNGGDLKAQQADKLISMLFADKFLSKVNTIRMSRLTRDVDALDVARRQLVRVAQGKEPEDDELTGAGEHGCKLTALDAQLFASLSLAFLRDNKDNPKLQSEIEKSFNTCLGNDIVDLGFNGIADDAEGDNRAAKFIRLNKGWLQITREADKTQKVEIDPATDGWKASLKAIMEKSDVRARAISSFVMNEADADEYGEEINAPVTGHEVQTAAPARRYKGKVIEAHPLCPRGSVLFTPMKNLVYGLHTTIDRNRAYHNRRRALEYTYDMCFDFEIAVKQFAVLGE
ncbi:P2 family phage major capsid protein [Thalassobius sp. I31.1]|uniref:P2 family phage major capsid protein n=1 Tax=Thalassobius sp. I31.1 TaxID=2109912 RepID=UPI000D1BE73F|nr:P2 family phage major capsid protein [Thalassobius sp. I31.1]